MRTITKESVKGESVMMCDHPNGDWAWKDRNENWHLIRDGIELTEGLEAKYVYSYPDGAWEWEDSFGNTHREKGEIWNT